MSYTCRCFAGRVQVLLFVQVIKRCNGRHHCQDEMINKQHSQGSTACVHSGRMGLESRLTFPSLQRCCKPLQLLQLLSQEIHCYHCHPPGNGSTEMPACHHSTQPLFSTKLALPLQQWQHRLHFWHWHQTHTLTCLNRRQVTLTSGSEPMLPPAAASKSNIPRLQYQSSSL